MGQALAFSDDPEETVYESSAGARLDATPLDRTPTGAASLESIPGLWRGDTLARVELESLPTGYDALNAQLPGGGWPLGALTEILNDRCGIGELRLFFPALAALSRQAGAPPVILLQPPYTPYAPAFAGAGIAPEQVLLLRTPRPEDALWACEQCLKYAPRCALFAWPQKLKPQDLRRLQLAVERRPVLAVLMREARAAQQSSAAALRIALKPGADGRQLHLSILKRRGALIARPVIVEPPSPLFFLPDHHEEPVHALDRPVPAATAA
ncbi:MAG TPA: translesion DNA synthesis-associated protein ImuA [Burkholderiales bacterium]|jgi:cell division inhibitor SulA